MCRYRACISVSVVCIGIGPCVSVSAAYIGVRHVYRYLPCVSVKAICIGAWGSADSESDLDGGVRTVNRTFMG